MSANLPLFNDLPYYGVNAGISTSLGTLVPPGSKIVAYVRSTGPQSGDPQFIFDRLVTTLQAGLNECRSGMGDIVVVLPGHSETVTSTSFTGVIGARVIGMGDISRDDAPTFTWSSAAATWAITAKNMEFRGLRLLMDNFNGVTAPINVTASGVRFLGNYMRWSSGASNLATTAVTVGSGATDFTFVGNKVYGVAAGICTDGIKLLGATTPDRCTIANNIMVAAATSARGLINVSVAALDVEILGNDIVNLAATSIAAISYSNVAATGICKNNTCTVFSTGAVSAGVTGVTVGGTNNLTGFFNNLTVNDVNKSGLLTPAADT